MGFCPVGVCPGFSLKSGLAYCLLVASPLVFLMFYILNLPYASIFCQLEDLKDPFVVCCEAFYRFVKSFGQLLL